MGSVKRIKRPPRAPSRAGARRTSRAPRRRSAARTRGGTGDRARQAGASDDLPRVEQLVGVERGLDRPHEADALGPVLELEVLRLAVADAVLARARAAELDRALHEPLVERD